jgi:hypothetical protein
MSSAGQEPPVTHRAFVLRCLDTIEDTIEDWDDPRLKWLIRRFGSFSSGLTQMALQGVLLLRAWRLRGRVPWPWQAILALLVAELLRLAAAAAPLAADRRPVRDQSPPAAVLIARVVLTAAPPARVPATAGTTG